MTCLLSSSILSLPAVLSDVDARLASIMQGAPASPLATAARLVLCPSKRLRPALTLASAAAAQLPTRTAMSLAAAVELIHVFSLIHDDIEDDAPVRRGQPALHVTEGMPVALNAGDALHARAWQEVMAMDAPSERVLAVARALGETLAAMVDGQALDLVWRRDRPHNLTLEDYRNAVRGKTGALFGFSAAAPLILAGHQAAPRLRAFGEELGIGFQILDDVACEVASAAVLGKPAGPGTDGHASVIPILKRSTSEPVSDAIAIARVHLARAHAALSAARLPLEDHVVAVLDDALTSFSELVARAGAPA